MAEAAFQRLDHWMWCARLLKTRGACARYVAETGLRINRLPTDKPHAKLRPGDVLTFAIGGGAIGGGAIGGDAIGGGAGGGRMEGGRVRVLRVRALATRRGPAAEARALFEEIAEAAPAFPVPAAGAMAPALPVTAGGGAAPPLPVPEGGGICASLADLDGRALGTAR